MILFILFPEYLFFFFRPISRHKRRDKGTNSKKTRKKISRKSIKKKGKGSNKKRCHADFLFGTTTTLFPSQEQSIWEAKREKKPS